MCLFVSPPSLSHFLCSYFFLHRTWYQSQTQLLISKFHYCSSFGPPICSIFLGMLPPLLSSLCLRAAICQSVLSFSGTPLQYSCLENPTDRGAWWAAVHGVAKSRTRLSDFTFTFHFHALEKEMATHSSVLAWRIPGMEEPGGLPYMRLHRVKTQLKRLSSSSSNSASKLSL